MIHPVEGVVDGGEEVEIHFTLRSYAKHKRTRRTLSVPFPLPKETQDPAARVRVMFGDRQADVVRMCHSSLFHSKHLSKVMHSAWDNCASGDNVVVVRVPKGMRPGTYDVGLVFTTIPFSGCVKGAFQVKRPVPVPVDVTMYEDEDDWFEDDGEGFASDVSFQSIMWG